MPDVKNRPLPDPDDLPIGDEPVIAWATIAKEKTDDEMYIVEPKMVGARIAVNLRTRRSASLYNKVHKKYYACEIIDTVDNPSWIPTSILDVDL